MICTACRSLTEARHTGFHQEPLCPRDQVRHLSYNDLSRSQYGCTLCARIWATLPYEETSLAELLAGITEDKPYGASLKDRTMKIYATRYIRPRGPWDSLTIQTSISSNTIFMCDRALPKTPADDVVSDIRIEVTSKVQPPSGLDCFKQQLDQVQRWMNQCDYSHESCKNGLQSRPWLPTRLIEVRSDSEIRLRESRSLAPETKYATLSHCWGHDKFLTLSKASFDQFLHGIPAEDLNKTFMEAIQACRELGIDYIWIDSLCIIQDSETDWQAEVTSMHQVYTRSYLNLAASASSNGSGGLFRPWSDRLLEDCCFKHSDGKWYSHPFDSNLFKYAFCTSPLHSRAWVVQVCYTPCLFRLRGDSGLVCSYYFDSRCICFTLTQVTGDILVAILCFESRANRQS